MTSSATQTRRPRGDNHLRHGPCYAGTSCESRRDTAVIPEAWDTAVAQAAPGQIPAGTVAYTIEGTRHRDGTWGTESVEASRPVSFTVFIVCTPAVTNRGVTGTTCELLRLSQLDNPLR